MAETYNDINLKSLVFNKVTNEEYRQMVQNGTIKDDEFYITPSELIDVPNIDSTTSGKYLTNDGTGALWSDVQSTNVVQDLSNPSADTVPSTKAVSDESSRIMSVMDNIYANLYPVGSIYIGTQNTCPLATLIAGSQWQKVATQVVTNVNTGVAVYGNGKALMITDGQHNSYMQTYDAYNAVAVKVSKQDYGNNIQNAGATLSMDKPNSIVKGAIGVINNASKSGLTGSLTRTNLALNIWKRTA